MQYFFYLCNNADVMTSKDEEMSHTSFPFPLFSSLLPLHLNPSHLSPSILLTNPFKSPFPPDAHTQSLSPRPVYSCLCVVIHPFTHQHPESLSWHPLSPLLTRSSPLPPLHPPLPLPLSFLISTFIHRFISISPLLLYPFMFHSFPMLISPRFSQFPPLTLFPFSFMHFSIYLFIPASLTYSLFLYYLSFHISIFPFRFPLYLSNYLHSSFLPFLKHLNFFFSSFVILSLSFFSYSLFLIFSFLC